MKKKFSFALLFFFLGSLVVAYVIYFASKETTRTRKIDNEIEGLKQEAEKIKEDNDALKDKIAYFETNEFKERVAKEKLNLKKENENVVAIKQNPVAIEEKSPIISINKSETEDDNSEEYVKWWNFFFGY
ncbi:MAG: hypothetical protein ACD_11C00021G0005 [uncultured bacterium]|nr:MAG: hypothetical protein ACD_11C00021G0005 [uncultured bacterium]HBR71354.1 hypothetical protein [Candidatus Moranbacteria bacterium]